MDGPDNPLITGELFEFGAWNIRASSRTSKDGPVYRISLEVDQQAYQAFMDAAHAIAELELQGRAVAG